MKGSKRDNTELKSMIIEYKEVFNLSGIERKFKLSDGALGNFIYRDYLTKKNRDLLVSELKNLANKINNIDL